LFLTELFKNKKVDRFLGTQCRTCTELTVWRWKQVRYTRRCLFSHFCMLICSWRVFTGPPTCNVGASIVLLIGVCHRLSSSVTPWRRIWNVTHQGAARDGGPVVLHPIRATPCFSCYGSMCILIMSQGCDRWQW